MNASQTPSHVELMCGSYSIALNWRLNVEFVRHILILLGTAAELPAATAAIAETLLHVEVLV